MKIVVQHNNIDYQADLSKPIDISIPLSPEGVNCFYAPAITINPVVADSFIGDTAQGGIVNFKNIQFNPHGNGTHTECVGHIATKKYDINVSLQKFHYLATVISVTPEILENGDSIVTKKQLEHLTEHTEALVIRTLPNHINKKQRKYSGTNPTYLHHEAVHFLVENGVEHLLVDLPSLDRESDEGKLLAHKAFWNYPSSQVRQNATITELIYVPEEAKDGLYLLNIGIAPFANIDATPSKPTLYELTC